MPQLPGPQQEQQLGPATSSQPVAAASSPNLRPLAASASSTGRSPRGSDLSRHRDAIASSPAKACSRQQAATVSRQPQATSAAAANDSRSATLIKGSGRTSISQTPRRVTVRWSGVWERRFPQVSKEILSGCVTTSTTSPAKSRAGGTRLSSRLSAPW
ncbi:hypothetical protein ABZ858_01010 [Streptomyces sp. NPDC047017]|uniref:hypothetical protein n=1 Tax=Streptomyces sp. NPDC047017 TaxID=3155024 RepID=UPI0033C0B797